ncbi:MAG TPA: alpha/beta hydrolase [Solirubrobacteraceae bacterium]|nr:alpha/beta hydrolase [Solirubrobacteraceae bacterium]
MVCLLAPASSLAARGTVRPPAVLLPEPERIFYGPKLVQRGDVYPSTKPGSPIVILVHGGGWRKQTGLYFLKRPATDLQAQGFTVFNINYRQDLNLPAFPREPEDIVTATRYAIAHAAAYNGDPTKVVYVAGSAGANVAALAAEQLDEAAPGTVRGVASLSGPMNFETLLTGVKNHTITNENFVLSIFMAMGGSEEDVLDPAAWEAIPRSMQREGSPVFNIPQRGCPSWLLISSEVDLVPLSQSQEMYSALAAAHCRATLEVLPGTGHGFAYWNQVSDDVASFIAGA